MKNLLYLTLLLLFVACSPQVQKKDPRLSFNPEWKFTTGDNPAYSEPGFDDSGWENLKTNAIWENLGHDPYDGYAWYRTKILIPSSLKNESSLTDSLLFFLGKINNFDQTYLNGQFIGSNNRKAAPGAKPDSLFIKAPTNYWDLQRWYTLASDDQRILWDQENVLAVRVYDEGGQGGLYTGDQYISMTRLSMYVKFDNKEHPFIFDGQDVNKSFSIKNHSANYAISGSFSIKAINKISGQDIYSKNEHLQLKPGDSKEFAINLHKMDQSATLVYSFLPDKTADTMIVRDETPYILTPQPSKNPKITGASVYGARPGKPFLFLIPATGERPLKYAATGLPEGLSLDEKTGIITGVPGKKGDYTVEVTVENEFGKDARNIKFAVGDQIALTPPMGWNSWNCWGLSVDAGKVIASAKTFKEKGLASHGWSFINIDDGWEIPKDREPKRDKSGNILTNEKFPDMKALGDSIHKMGLKFGIYSSPGPLTCGGYTASYQHEINDARSYASWGIDYLKYDWCSYDGIAKDTSLAERKKPYFVMRDALAKMDRDIVYSLCQYGMSKVWTWGNEVGGNLWRTTGDITDTWESLREIGFSQVENQPYAKPGNWNDPDMLIVGWVGWGPNLHPTKLTPDEQYTHISLWCLLSSPLLIGCDLERLDDFTLNLLTNDEVLAINQDPLGSQAIRTIVDGDIQVWVKQLADGNKAFGIFNLGDKTSSYTLNLSKIGLDGNFMFRDLWRQKDLGNFNKDFQVQVPSHGVVMVKAVGKK